MIFSGGIYHTMQFNVGKGTGKNNKQEILGWSGPPKYKEITKFLVNSHVFLVEK